jgi:hypothetical protein
VATAAIADNDIWAVGRGGVAPGTLAEHFDGTRWTLFSAPAGAGLAALSDGTVVVVSGDSILEN